MRRQRTSALDEGFSLTELLVVVVLFSIVGAIITVTSVTALHQQTKVQNRSDAISQARAALERVDRDIRSTYPLLAATPTRLVLQEAQPSGTRTVTYAVTNHQLTVNGTVLLRSLVNTTTTPVFSFSPITGYVAPSGSGVTASTCAMAGGSYDPGCVGSITVHLMVQPAGLAAPVSLSDDGTSLRNAQ